MLGGLLLLLTGCGRLHQGWEPPLEETSTRFLQQETDEALRLVQAAQEAVATETHHADEDLAGAARALERISLYYLPMLEAREIE